MKPTRLILFAGMGADSRLVQPIRLSGLPVITPEHLEPLGTEDLSAYAARVAEVHQIGPTDVIGGASFGGMLAAEISRQRAVAGLILLGSTVRPRRLPKPHHWLEKMAPRIPDWAFGIRSWPFMIRWRLAPLTPEAEACLLAMATECTVAQIRNFGRMAIHWPGVKKFKCPVLAIHGDRDKIIPIDCAHPGLTLKNAGHTFTLTHTEETISAIQEFIHGIPDGSGPGR